MELAGTRIVLRHRLRDGVPSPLVEVVEVVGSVGPAHRRLGRGERRRWLLGVASEEAHATSVGIGRSDAATEADASST